MGVKNNFNQATYELFGIGAEPQDGQNQTGNKEHVSKPETLIIERVTPEISSQQQTSYIAPGSVFEGTLRTPGNVQIAGEFRGDIYSEGRVELRTSITGNITAKELELIDCELTGDLKVNDKFIIGAKSSVKGNVVAQAVECAGNIVGDVFVERELSLKGCAEITGDIHTALMTMDRGAKVHGNVEMSAAANTTIDWKGSE